MSVSAVLFDLDGTLIDTADDLSACLNLLLEEEAQPALPFSVIRKQVSNGANAMIRMAFGSSLNEARAEHLRHRLLHYYENNIARHSQWFDGLEELAYTFRSQGIPWGIVTNKPRLYTDLLLDAMAITPMVDVVVCPDDLGIAKPDPRPLFHACEVIQATPQHAIYVGDHIRDIQAGKAAGMKTVAVSWGYIEDDDDINQWQADHIIHHGTELRKLLAL